MLAISVKAPQYLRHLKKVKFNRHGEIPYLQYMIYEAVKNAIDSYGDKIYDQPKGATSSEHEEAGTMNLEAAVKVRDEKLYIVIKDVFLP